MKTIIWIIVMLFILAGGWWYLSVPTAETVPTTPTTSTDVNTPVDAATTDTTPVPSATGTTAPMTATVMYSAQGFTPSTVTITKGGKVTWVNQSGAAMWVASNEHPSHRGYAGTTRQEHCPDAPGAAFDQCAPGDSYSFTFNKSGTWNYHDHMKASSQGVVIVQ